jgi:hypothetical protein
MRKKIAKLLKLNGVKLTAFYYLLLLAPLALLFSYRPLINFGVHSAMHIELSIAMLYLLALALVGLPQVYRARHTLAADKAVWLASIFVIIDGLSLLWTPNLLRGVLTFGVLGLLYLTFLAILASQNLVKLLPALSRLTIAAGVLVSLIAWLQLILETSNLPPSLTLLCDGCRAGIFGFARPDGFAIEPQFLGSLLIAPIVLTFRRFMNRKIQIGTSLVLVFLTSTMILTLSRGAIYALAAGMLVIVAANWRRLKRLALGVGLMLAAVMLAFGAQGLAAQLNPRINSRPDDTIAKSIHHLTLGLVDWRAKQPEPAAAPSRTTTDGYIEESTTIRTDLTTLALDTWWQSSSVVVAGVGLGGAGQSMQAYKHQTSASEIVQNQYVETLLELGLVGLMVFAIILGLVLLRLQHYHYLQAILVAFLAQWWFFSGYPNALHVYLIIIIGGWLALHKGVVKHVD